MAGELSVTGLVGNFDINSVLQQIQAIKSQQILLLQQKQQTISAKKSAVSDIQNILKNIQNTVNNITDPNIAYAKSIALSNPNVATVSITDPTQVQTGTYSLTVNQLAQNDVYATSTAVSDKNDPLGLSSGTLTIRIKGVDYNVVYDNTFSLQALADEINRTAQTYNGDFRASVVNVGTQSNPQYKLVISGTKTGQENALTISDSGNLISTLGLDHIKTAQDAQINYEGLTINSSTNTFTNIPGLSITVNQTGNTTITVNKDSKPITDALNSIINGYNNLVNTLNKETGKDGRLSGEYSLNIIKSGLYRQLEPLLTNGVIKYDRTNGNISLNTTKLQDMITNNPNDLQDILTQVKDNVYNYLKDYTQTSGVIDTKLKSYDKQINSIQSMIDQINKRIQTEIQTLKNQFIYMQNLQAQYNDISARIQATFGLQTNK
ncbi:flagellar filament capping protein FliD [Sulfurihydrogenibium subterraneum]|uniref:flagellar filament capping protein FliD n=1 Tax=Sulfurihydrogenibium subterraneum TaxID=171121 RepID=UPI00048BBACB|nr:flagellar filament capping protein FliD [Sulfurihydrogenibium subterraneum]